MIQCMHCGWKGSFEELKNGIFCPICFKSTTENIYKSGLIITKIIKL